MKKVLLIEDDDIKANDICSFIDEAYPYDIERQFSITGGLRALRNKFDYILLDMSLPRFSENSLKNFEPFGGIEVIKEIERKKIEVDVIVITQYAIFGEGALRRTLEDIKQQCSEYKINFKDVIKYSRDSSEWKIELKKYL